MAKKAGRETRKNVSGNGNKYNISNTIQTIITNTLQGKRRNVDIFGVIDEI